MPLQLPRRYRLQGVPNGHRKYYYHEDSILSSYARVPLKQQYATIERFSTVRLSAGSSVSDTILTVEPVANGDFANVVGEFSGGGINNLNEEEMDTLTQEIEETLLKKALSNKNSKEWAELVGPRKKSKGELGLIRMNAQRKKGPTYQRQMKEH